MHPWADQALQNRWAVYKRTQRWNLKNRDIRQQWMEFKTHYIDKYEKMLAANGGTTMGQEGYGTGRSYNLMDDDGSSLAEIIVQYAERATQAEGKVNKLESILAALEMGPPPTQPQTGYYAPQMAYGMMPGGPPPPTSIQIPPAYQHPQQQSNGRKRNNNDYNRGGQRRRPKKLPRWRKRRRIQRRLPQCKQHPKGILQRHQAENQLTVLLLMWIQRRP